MRAKALLLVLSSLAVSLGACGGAGDDNEATSTDAVSGIAPGRPGGACGGAREVACADPTTACNGNPEIANAPGKCVPKFFQRGRVVDGRSGNGIAGATVSSGATSIQADADGNYALPVAFDTPYFLKVSAPGYWPFTDMAIKLHEDAVRPVRLPSDTAWWAWDLAATFSFAHRDRKLGVLGVSAWSTGKCLAGTDPLVARADGIVFEVHGDADLSKAKVVYSSGTGASGLDWFTNSSAQTNAIPHAIFYNLPTGVDLTVTMKNAPCRQLDYPIEWKKMIFTSGTIQTKPGNAWAFTRTWME